MVQKRRVDSAAYPSATAVAAISKIDPPKKTDGQPLDFGVAFSLHPRFLKSKEMKHQVWLATGNSFRKDLEDEETRHA